MQVVAWEQYKDNHFTNKGTLLPVVSRIQRLVVRQWMGNIWVNVTLISLCGNLIFTLQAIEVGHCKP